MALKAFLSSQILNIPPHFGTGYVAQRFQNKIGEERFKDGFYPLRSLHSACLLDSLEYFLFQIHGRYLTFCIKIDGCYSIRSNENPDSFCTLGLFSRLDHGRMTRICHWESRQKRTRNNDHFLSYILHKQKLQWIFSRFLSC